jgi:pyridinium-3,5-biscarboxylic acid mononucleotide sulfurtransferase
MSDLENKQARLEAELAAVPSLLVAYSGGVDSALLAYAAHKVLGDRMLAVTALSESYSADDRRKATDCAQQLALPHEFIETHEVSNPAYRANAPNRCFYCKDELFTELDALASQRGYAAVAYGVNLDDLADWRPGQQAARDHRVLTPLVAAELSKAEIRELARRAGVPVWDRPASPCLASRIAYGIEVTAERLRVVEQGEEALRALGFTRFRLRHHDKLARIEIAAEELPRALDPGMAGRFVEALKALGFTYVTLDLEGYRQGSLNSGLTRITDSGTRIPALGAREPGR